MNCRACKGSRGFRTKSGKWVDCKVCGGSGINRELWETHCRECYAPIVFRKDQTEPTYCKECRNKEKTKSCGQWGCTNTIRYKLGWSEIPEYCGRCKSKRQQGWIPSSCSGTGMFGCGKLIWSPPGKRFDLCPDCNARKREADAQKWREKPCPGLKGQGYCGNTIRYRTDWDKVPDICPDCRTKAKTQRAEREAKMREKPCAGGCGATIKYSVDWEHPPNFCPSCKQKRQQKHEPNQSENPRFHAACGDRGAKLTEQEEDRFSEYFHQLPDRQRMSFDEIVRLADEWKRNNGGGFRRSDRR